MKRTESGATLIMISLSIVAIFATAGLAIDGGRIFSSRRQAQNAADAAALAGADALFAYQYAAATNAARDPTTINQAVLNKLSQNSDGLSIQCQLIDAQLNVLEPCLGASDAQLIAASGVQASGSVHQSATFVQVVGIHDYAAHAASSATVQPLVGTGTPFIVCGAAKNGWNILNPDDSINIPAAEQLINIPLEKSNVPDCGAGPNKFKGLNAPGGGPVGIGQWSNTTLGNAYSSIAANAVDGQVPCPSDPTQIPASGCGLLVPIANNARGTSSIQMHIVAYAIFFVTPVSGSNGTKYEGTFVAPASLALLGQGDFGVHCAAGTQVCTAKLSQ